MKEVLWGHRMEQLTGHEGKTIHESIAFADSVVCMQEQWDLESLFTPDEIHQSNLGITPYCYLNGC